MSSRAKNFEHIFKEQASKLENVLVMRLPDQQSFLKGSYNICDFICFRRPHFFCIELKSVQTPSLASKLIADTQLDGMYEALSTRGVKAFVVIWFVGKDVTIAFPVKYLYKLFRVQGKKSVRYDDEHGIIIPGKKLKKYFEYDWSPLFR